MAARSEASVCVLSLAGIAGSNPAESRGCMSLVTDVVLSGRSMCVGLFTRPE